MANEKFSRRGTPPTDYELRLLQNAAGDGVWLDIARQLMESQGTEQGARALLVILDAIGTEKVHVPCREALFRSLHRVERDRQVLELRATGGATIAQIACEVELTTRRVKQIVKRSGRRARKTSVGSRA